MRSADRQGHSTFRGGSRGLGRSGKLLVPLLGGLAALGVIGIAVSAVLGWQEHKVRLAKEHELREALLQNDDLQSRLKDLQQTKTRVEQELAQIRQELTASQEELARAVETRTTLSRSVEDREREIARLTQDLSDARGQSKTASDQLTQLQSERDAMQQQLAELERAKDDLEAKVMEASDQRPTVELEKVLVSNSPESFSGTGRPMPVSLADGQVVVVNREYDFIVMNMGKNHGLAVGQEFQVLRDSQVLGRVKVEKVYDELSAATILPESQKDNIREGDIVRAL